MENDKVGFPAGRGLVVTGRILKAARMLADLTSAQLAEISGVGLRTIKRAESADMDSVKLNSANLEKITGAFAELNVTIFGATEGVGAGVRYTGLLPEEAVKRMLTVPSQSDPGRVRRRRPRSEPTGGD